MQKSTSVLIFRLLSVMAVLLSPIAALAQATINVPRDQPTIQAAINAAIDGDTVLVAPGTYVENINFQGKAITVTSSGGAANTTLDGGGVGPAVTFAYAEPRTAVLFGFTIQNGGGYGSNPTALGIAGVLINSSSPTILNNIITQNQCYDIEVLFAAPLIQGNTISSTQTPAGGCGPGSGAGIYINGNLNGETDDGSTAIVIGNTIENIIMPESTQAAPNSSNLSTENGGAGIAVFGGNPLIEDNILRNNAAPGGNGGAINIAGGSGTTILQNLIYGNSAGCGGGAISFGVFTLSEVDLLIANNTIVDNTGGSATPFASCGDVSQIYETNYGFSTPDVVFVNNIVSGNTAAAAIGCPTVSVVPSEANQSIFDHNLLYNAGGSVFGPSCVDVSAKYGNLSSAPQFANAAQGDYHLLTASPGIDTGNNSALGNLSNLSGTSPSKDFDGNARVQDATGTGIPIIDMGVYEHAGVVDGSPTTIILTSSTYAGTPGAPLSLLASIASPLGVPTGSIAFFLDGQQIGVSTLSSGFAFFNSVVPSVGAHSLYAAYQGTGKGASSFIAADSVIIIVTGNGSPAGKTYTTNLQMGVATNPQTYGQPETITVIGASDDPNTAFSPSPITLTVNHGVVLASVTPIAEGIFRFTTTTLPVGEDTITATYAGDATHQGSTASVEVDIQGVGTGIVLGCSPRIIQVGQTASLSASVTADDGSSPTGPVAFSDNGTLFADIPVVNGSANWTYIGTSTGAHDIQAFLGASGKYEGGGSVSCFVPLPPPQPPPTPYILVTGLNSKSGLSVNPTTLPFEGTTTLTATVSPAVPPGDGTPTGTVNFFDGTTLLGTANLAGGIASFTTFALPFGGSFLTCAYLGDSIYAPSNCNSVAVTTVLTQPAIVITPSANPVPALSPVTFDILLSVNGHAPTDDLVVQISFNNQTVPVPLIEGFGEYTVSNLLPGNYPLTVTFSGNSSLASASASLVEVVGQNPSTTTLSAAPSTAYVGQPVTLSALVTGVDTLVPEGGSVTFYDGPTALGTETFGQYRTATLTTSSLAPGVHPITAVYAGNSGFSGSTSQVVNVTILASSFTISLAPPTVTLPPLQATTVTVQLASVGNFAGPLTLSYSPLPANASASFLPPVVTLTAGGTGSSTLTLKTVTPTLVSAGQSAPFPRSPRGAAWPTLLAAALLLLYPKRGRRWMHLLGNKRRLLLWLVLTAGLLQTVTGCIDVFYVIPSIAPGSYQIQITATDANQNKQTAVLTLVVPPLAGE